jgi:hypothetical protein
MPGNAPSTVRESFDAMRPQRIKTAFHRIGLAIAVVCGVPGAILLVLGWPWNEGGAEGNPHVFYGVLALVWAGAGYALARALGWIVASLAHARIRN